ncbi:NAD(P)-binding domain-containing protein [Xanthomonas campestris pv. raphani]|uniref:NADPH-dependent F420 reductase n=1 Tax=Xanthomonas campestris TaxID=339 RepID=UPI002B239156|nr:NAD(P)-binding domain-containing protein [Xanthomonas campestris]MEA9788908.1 NAD(P)-binding domain-containing protein [Xanthomonas campestris pv. raphani]
MLILLQTTSVCVLHRTLGLNVKIGILGSGHIGKTLVRRLAAAGHDVKVANSRGPETIDSETLANGGRAVTAEEAIVDVEVVILSIPFKHIPAVAPLLSSIPSETVVIDTSNYYPARDGEIAAIDQGQVESLWVAEQLGRPIAKAWNAIGSGSFADKDKTAGDPQRIAIPIAADREQDRRVTVELVNDTGLDAVDAGSLSESWRQQPGSPVYCTDLTREQIPQALADADKARLRKRLELVMAVIVERFGPTGYPDGDYLVRINRAVFM